VYLVCAGCVCVYGVYGVGGCSVGVTVCCVLGMLVCLVCCVTETKPFQLIDWSGNWHSRACYPRCN